jgi:hypothetical protein
MTDKYSGGPVWTCDEVVDQYGSAHKAEGMTLRDYFAAKAMQGLMVRNWSSHTGTDEELIAIWARSSYAVAAAMLKARVSE